MSGIFRANVQMLFFVVCMAKILNEVTGDSRKAEACKTKCSTMHLEKWAGFLNQARNQLGTPGGRRVF